MQYLYIVNEQTKTEFLLSYENLRTCFDKKQLPKQYPVGTIFLVIANFLLLIFSRKSDRCLEQIDSNQMAHILSKLHAEHKNFSDTKILLYQIFDDLEAYDSNLETKFPIHVLQLIESFCSESSFCENGKLKNALLHLGKLPLLRKDFPLPDFEDMPDKNTLKHYCKVFMFSPDFEFLSCDIEGIEALTWLCGSCKSLQNHTIIILAISLILLTLPYKSYLS